MTDSTTNSTTTEETITNEVSVTPTETTEDAPSPNAEAAKYRRRLRETEQERDALAEQLAGVQREVFRMQNGVQPNQMERIEGSNPDEMMAQLEAFKSFGTIHQAGYVPTAGTGEPAPSIDAAITWKQALESSTNRS